MSLRFRRVIVAEKPSLAKTIADAIGVQSRGDGFLHNGDTAVTWCIGHLFEQAKPDDYDEQYKTWRIEDLPIVPERWKLLPKAATKDQLGKASKLIVSANEVVNAGDPDREGQLLVDELIEYAKPKANILRVWLQDLTPDGVRKAFAKLKPNADYKALKESALARSRADWLIGMNLTRAYTLVWKKYGGSDVLHVGRVQTPTLGIVVKRDREIESFVPRDYFTGLVRVRHKSGDFSAKWISPKTGEGIDADGRVIDKTIVEKVLSAVAGKSGAIASLKTERKQEAPPLPYTLADLQKDAHKALGLSPQDTLDIAQSLYETHKLTTYPRSDCPYLPEAEHANARAVLTAVYKNFGKEAWEKSFPGKADLSRKTAAWNDKKLGAHHGIIPTAHQKPIDQLTSNEVAVYRLIVRRYLAQFYPNHVYDSTSLQVEVGGHRFAANGSALIDAGWKALWARDEAERDADKKNEETTLPPGMKQGDSVDVIGTECKQGKTTPPPRMNGASLIEAMQKAHLYVSDPAMKAKLKETQGIGTEATRAAIIQSLVDRGYIEERPRQKGKGTEFVSSERGRALIDFVSDSLKNVDLTAWFEGKLDGVLDGSESLLECEGEMRQFVADLVRDAIHRKPPSVCAQVERICPTCGKAMTRRKGKNGEFWGCLGFPDCRQTLPMAKEEMRHGTSNGHRESKRQQKRPRNSGRAATTRQSVRIPG